MGNDGRPSVTLLDDAYVNQDRVAYHRRKAMKPYGIRPSFSALLQLNKDLPRGFFLKMEIAKHDKNIITLQSPYMKKVLHEAASSLQSDTVEGAIFDNGRV